MCAGACVCVCVCACVCVCVHVCVGVCASYGWEMGGGGNVWCVFFSPTSALWACLFFHGFCVCIYIMPYINHHSFIHYLFPLSLSLSLCIYIHTYALPHMCYSHFYFSLSQAPEFYFTYLKQDLGLTSLNDLMHFSDAIDKLPWFLNHLAAIDKLPWFF